MYLFAWWRHQMERFSALLALCAGNSPVPVNSLHKGQWRGTLMFSLIYAWINDWVNNREGGDLRRQRGHNDVIVMVTSQVLPCYGLARSCTSQFVNILWCYMYISNYFIWCVRTKKIWFWQPKETWRRHGCPHRGTTKNGKCLGGHSLV